MLRRLLTLSNGVHSKEREREREREKERAEEREEKRRERRNSPQWRGGTKHNFPHECTADSSLFPNDCLN